MSRNRGWARKGSDLVRSVGSDIKDSSFSHELQRDFNESIEYYLNGDQKTRLASMGRVKQSIYLTFWLIKILFLRLSLVRRTLFVLGAGLIFFGQQRYQGGLTILGGLILIWLLLVELKDKLFAKEELAEGHAVQAALMPSSTPDIRGWSVWLFTAPANDVGGDLVDHLPLGEERHGIALGDVAGKGLSAALYMAKLQSTLRACVADTPDLGELGDKINHIFCRDAQSNRFASMVFLTLDAGGAVQLLNAGHLPPLVKISGQLKPLKKGGPAFGLSRSFSYTGESLNLAEGDWMLIYSDGATESTDEAGEFFGEDRFRTLVDDLPDEDSPRMGRRILSELAQFRGRARLHDDISMAIIKRTHP